MSIQQPSRIYEYSGPKAIYDPYYLPPQLLYRKRETKSLFSLLKDSVEDHFNLNILYQGINGIGKKVLVNKVLYDLKKKGVFSPQDLNLLIDCSGKTVEEFIFLFISELCNSFGYNLNINRFLSNSVTSLWNLLKSIFRKINHNVVIFLVNTEDLDLEFLSKFLNFGKGNNATILATLNKSLRPKNYDILSHFDYKRQLNYFTFKQLFLILKQRFSLTFQRKIDDGLIDYITDIICENFAPIPGKGVEIMKILYPLLVDYKDPDFSNLIDLIQTHFVEFNNIDEFAMLNYLAEGDPLTLLFLDNLSSHLLNSSFNYYISKPELQELYFIACEYLDYPKEKNEFNLLLKKILKIGVLTVSNKFKHPDSEFSENLLFSTLNPVKLKAMIDVIFGNCN